MRMHSEENNRLLQDCLYSEIESCEAEPLVKILNEAIHSTEDGPLHHLHGPSL